MAGSRKVEPAPAGRLDASVVDLSDSTCLSGSDRCARSSDRRCHDTRLRCARDFCSASHCLGVKNARLTLRAGFTTVRNLGAGDFADVALRERHQRRRRRGTRMVCLGRRSGSPRPLRQQSPPLRIQRTSDGVADGPWRSAPRSAKSSNTGRTSSRSVRQAVCSARAISLVSQQYTLEECRRCEEAHKLGRRVAAHAHGASSSGTPSWPASTRSNTQV